MIALTLALMLGPGSQLPRDLPPFLLYRVRPDSKVGDLFFWRNGKTSKVLSNLVLFKMSTAWDHKQALVQSYGKTDSLHLLRSRPGGSPYIKNVTPSFRFHPGYWQAQNRAVIRSWDEELFRLSARGSWQKLTSSTRVWNNQPWMHLDKLLPKRVVSDLHILKPKLGTDSPAFQRLLWDTHGLPTGGGPYDDGWSALADTTTYVKKRYWVLTEKPSDRFRLYAISSTGKLTKSDPIATPTGRELADMRLSPNGKYVLTIQWDPSKPDRRPVVGLHHTKVVEGEVRCYDIQKKIWLPAPGLTATYLRFLQP